MNKTDAQIGVRVRSLRQFSGVAVGTEGVIDELYGDETGQLEGCTVAWDMPDQPLPADYREYDGRPAIQSRILRDGFSWDDLRHLEAIRGPLPSGYWHKEAFCLMTYRCQLCQRAEQIWNARDGVTPFSMSCQNSGCNNQHHAGCPMQHVDWEKDKCYPEFVCHPGLRIFIDMPKPIAKALARMRRQRYLAYCEEKDIHAIDEQTWMPSAFDDIYREGKAPWVVTL